MGIRFEQVTHAYKSFGKAEVEALKEVDLSIRTGRFVSLLGSPGSGKSTLLQLCNGLLRPTAGTLYVLDFVIQPDKKSDGSKRWNDLRKRVGLVFQFPERQLFAETIEQDLMFGPLQCGLRQEEASAKARRAAAKLGLGDDVLKQSPFTLSGGQLRKAAIASVLAMDPDVFVLDEPTASLDQESRHELMQLLHRLCKQEGKTVIVVTHRSDEVLPYADDIVVLEQGKVIFSGSASEMFLNQALLAQYGIELPAPMRLFRRLQEELGMELPRGLHDPEEIAAAMIDVLQGGGGHE